MLFGTHDQEAIKILQDFLPGRIFDAHAHLDHPRLIKDVPVRQPLLEWHDTADYMKQTEPFFRGRQVALNFFMRVTVNDSYFNRAEERGFIRDELEACPGSTAEVITLPGDDTDTLAASLVHPRVSGFKCYHTFLHRPDSWQADIGEYLPEAAWALADRYGKCITLHLMKDRSLADPENLSYIKTMARKYPNAVLILAHAARSFASWTGVETVAQLKDLENVWYDFSAVCESPAVFQILHKIGVSRCMWGSDFPITCKPGRAVSMADGFHWINASDILHFADASTLHTWTYFTENLMAVRQACLMADLTARDVEDLFWNNAARLFLRK